jgi:hypothetical protein
LVVKDIVFCSLGQRLLEFFWDRHQWNEDGGAIDTRTKSTSMYTIYLEEYHLPALHRAAEEDMLHLRQQSLYDVVQATYRKRKKNRSNGEGNGAAGGIVYLCAIT